MILSLKIICYVVTFNLEKKQVRLLFRVRHVSLCSQLIGPSSFCNLLPDITCPEPG